MGSKGYRACEPAPVEGQCHVWVGYEPKRDQPCRCGLNRWPYRPIAWRDDYGLIPAERIVWVLPLDKGDPSLATDMSEVMEYFAKARLVGREAKGRC